MKWTPFRRGLAVFLTFFGSLSIAINSTSTNWLDLYRLARSGTLTQASVTAIHPENHRACDFAYTVGGHSYSHLESCHLLVGEASSLIYLPSEPSVAIVHSPDGELEAAIVVPLVMSMIFGIVAAFGTWLTTRRLARNVE